MFSSHHIFGFNNLVSQSFICNIIVLLINNVLVFSHETIIDIFELLICVLKLTNVHLDTSNLILSVFVFLNLSCICRVSVKKFKSQLIEFKLISHILILFACLIQFVFSFFDSVSSNFCCTCSCFFFSSCSFCSDSDFLISKFLFSISSSLFFCGIIFDFSLVTFQILLQVTSSFLIKRFIFKLSL